MSILTLGENEARRHPHRCKRCNPPGSVAPRTCRGISCWPGKMKEQAHLVVKEFRGALKPLKILKYFFADRRQGDMVYGQMVHVHLRTAGKGTCPPVSRDFRAQINF